MNLHTHPPKGLWVYKLMNLETQKPLTELLNFLTP